VQRCPCDSGESYEDCCRPLHRGECEAPTALALMRSRYAAFAQGDAAYLRRTWHVSTRPRSLELDADRVWTGLEIVATEAGGPFETSGVVEFRAHHRTGVQSERSTFTREGGRWYYLSGSV